MAKKKSTAQPKLSPENYIKKRARLLPLGKCYINEDWLEGGLAQIIVTRQHSNGNITAGIYLVDLLCLGTKDSFFLFNEPAEEINNILEEMEGTGMEMIEESYILVHNIIFSANDFADDYGFSPCKEFRTLTQYILEDDEIDDIELLDIHCGDKSWQPLYIAGVNDTSQEIKKTLATLEKNAGAGNYTFIENREDYMPEEDEFYDESSELMDELTEEIEEMSLDEKLNEFRSLRQELASTEKLEDKKMIKLRLIAENVVEGLIDADELDAEAEKWYKIEDEIEIVENDEIDILLNDEEKSKLSEELKEEILELTYAPPLEALKKITAFQKAHGQIAYLCYLEIGCLKITNNEELAYKKLKEYSELYPNDARLKLEHYTTQFINSDKKSLPPIEWNDYFANRESIHPIELLNYISLYGMVSIETQNPNNLMALSIHIDQIAYLYPKEYSDMLYTILFSSMIEFVAANFEQDKKGGWKGKLRIKR